MVISSLQAKAIAVCIICDRAAPLAYVATLRIANGMWIGGTSSTDDIDIINATLGPEYLSVVIVAQGGNIYGANHDFKLVP